MMSPFRGSAVSGVLDFSGGKIVLFSLCLHSRTMVQSCCLLVYRLQFDSSTVTTVVCLIMTDALDRETALSLPV
jgi:hypothetical protein